MPKVEPTKRTPPKYLSTCSHWDVWGEFFPRSAGGSIYCPECRAAMRGMVYRAEPESPVGDDPTPLTADSAERYERYRKYIEAR